MSRFEVTWSMEYQADDFRDAIEQAIGDLTEVVEKRRGCTIFVVRDDQGHQVAAHDIEYDCEV